MAYTIQRASDRGSADYGWLKPNYYFSFAQYHNPTRIHFGMLRVLNDDFIAGGGMFPPHPHDNMEIVTIPLSGAVQHQDSTGGKGIIRAGDVQIMSAGTGVVHSEANASATEPLQLFQIWVFPKVKNIAPRYDQKSFNAEDRVNKWQIVVSPLPEDQALWINQDARFAMTDISKGHSLDYRPSFQNSGLYLVVISGHLQIFDEQLKDRDAIGVSEHEAVTMTALADSQMLAIEVPMS